MCNNKQTLTDRQTYNCISLGWFCGTASTLGKLGLRNSSGPFDWYFSDFQGVLKQIEDRFTDFLNPTNLEVDKKNTRYFYDSKYGFYYNHDVSNDYETDYPEIYKKYSRRIARFLSDIESPSVLYRIIKDNDEVDYINRNWEYANSVIRAYNDNNRIIYVKPYLFEELTDKVESYDIGIEEYTDKTYELRHMFDTNKELLSTSKSFVSEDIIEKNTRFDINSNCQKAMAGWIDMCVEKDIDGVDSIILDALEVSDIIGIYLWGAGRLGIPLAKYLTRRGVIVKGIIDNDKTIGYVKDIAIIQYNEIEDGARIFISIADKEPKEAVMKQIMSSDKNVKVISYEDIYNERYDI